MAYDTVSKKVVMFGGYNGYSYLNGTWLFDGVNWTKVKTPVAHPRRANAQMAYDIVTKRVVLFGGYDGSKYLADMWTWDGATSSWTQATPAHSLTAVTGPMVFAVPNGRMADFGQIRRQSLSRNMWEWTEPIGINCNSRWFPTHDLRLA